MPSRLLGPGLPEADGQGRQNGAIREDGAYGAVRITVKVDLAVKEASEAGAGI